jgi:hypothetical protein
MEYTKEQITAMNEEQLKTAMTEAVTAGEWEIVKRLSARLADITKDAEKAAKEAFQKKLADVGTGIKGIFDKVMSVLTSGAPPTKEAVQAVSQAIRDFAKTGKELDGADGVWFAHDFGDSSSGIKLVKSAKSTASGTSKSSYVADPRKSEDLLKEFGDKPMFPGATEDVERTINKEKIVMSKAMTLNEAYKFSTNGGWRNAVRMQLIKIADAK